ncbi:MAG: hypothetical protein ACE5GN_07030 [Waddliaceae bacterium]
MNYLIEIPHSKKECLMALDEIAKEGKVLLGEFYYGCKAGDHAGYAIVDAENESEQRNSYSISCVSNQGSWNLHSLPKSRSWLGTKHATGALAP